MAQSSSTWFDNTAGDILSSLSLASPYNDHNDMVAVVPDAPLQHCQKHRIFLIRHGETVDNVAGLYAGIRDSALTSHGVQQTIRLGEYFASNTPSFTKIFSSDLSRALKTAEAIRNAQKPVAGTEAPSVIHNADLREQDFGYYEGKPFFARKKDSTASAKQDYSAEHKNDPGFKPMELKESLMRRANKFWNALVLPVLAASNENDSQVVAIVSHGMLLSALWKTLLKHQPAKSIIVDPGASSTRPITSLEHLGGWSNTGYLELHLSPTTSKSESSICDDAEAPVLASSDDFFDQSRPCSRPELASEYNITIASINSLKHLEGLKRTRGGVGSSKFDEGQKSIDSFFKKRKVDKAVD